MRKGKGEDFAVNHLRQKGWSEGEGLGRGGHGMAEAIKPKLKFDNSGLGHDRGEEFTFNWWEHAFNKAAQNVQVEEDHAGEVKVTYTNDKDLSVKKTKVKKKAGEKKKNLLYSSFVKSGTLVGGKLDEGEKDEIVEEDLSKKVTDEELVKSCGGLTAHKGGRHGMKMSAKLKRIEEAEKVYLKQFAETVSPKEDSTPTNLSVPVSPLAEEKELKRKKNKKRKKECSSATTFGDVKEGANIKKKKSKCSL